MTRPEGEDEAIEGEVSTNEENMPAITNDTLRRTSSRNKKTPLTRNQDFFMGDPSLNTINIIAHNDPPTLLDNSTCTNLCSNTKSKRNKNDQNSSLSNLHSKSSETGAKKDTDKLIIFHQNIQGLRNKINEFIISMLEIKPHLICLSEHHIKDMYQYVPYIPTYKLGATFSRTTLKCGGVCIYINEEIEHSNINLNNYYKQQDLEIIAVKFKFNNKKFIILCGYLAPAGNLEYFFEKLDCTHSDLQRANIEIVLCGDLNINYAENNPNKTQLENLLDTYNLKATVHFPTRITASTTSIIDNIFIEKHRDFAIKQHINRLSNHDAQLLILNEIIQMKPQIYNSQEV